MISPNLVLTPKIEEEIDHINKNKDKNKNIATSEIKLLKHSF